MPLQIKTAVRNADGATVRAVLVTPSIRAEDIDNLVGSPVNADVRVTETDAPYSVKYADVAFPYGGLGVPGRHVAGTTVPGYLLWDGAQLRAATPRVFAQEYVVVARHDPEPRVSHHYG